MNPLVVRAMAALVTVGAARPPAPAADPLVARGRQVAERSCRGCHTFQHPGEPDVLAIDRTEGPDLSYAGTKFQASWLGRWLVAPTRLRPAGYLSYRYVTPTSRGDVVEPARIPRHPALSAEDAPAVAAFLQTLKRPINPYPAGPPNESIRAEVHFSKLLPCGGCHQARVGAGGISGPELITAAERLDPDWLGSMVADPGAWRPGIMPAADIRAEQVGALVQYLTGGATGPREVADAPASPASSAPAPAPALGRAERLYRLLCTQCHGVTGNGKGINARFLFVAPRNHTSAAEMERLTADEVARAIRYGGVAVGKSAMMPAWGGVLKPEDVTLLASYVRGLCNSSDQNNGQGNQEGASNGKTERKDQ